MSRTSKLATKITNAIATYVRIVRRGHTSSRAAYTAMQTAFTEALEPLLDPPVVADPLGAAAEKPMEKVNETVSLAVPWQQDPLSAVAASEAPTNQSGLGERSAGSLSNGNALELLVHGNEWLRQERNKGYVCHCNACHLCALQTLAALIFEVHPTVKSERDAARQEAERLRIALQRDADEFATLRERLASETKRADANCESGMNAVGDMNRVKDELLAHKFSTSLKMEAYETTLAQQMVINGLLQAEIDKLQPIHDTYLS